MSLLTTPSQTVGPYLRIGFTALAVDAIAPSGAAGEHVTIEGRVTDGDGNPVSDAVLEVWQADADGKYVHAEDGAPGPGKFRGFGRILTDAEGAFRFTTIKPGRVAGPKGAMQAPHLVVTVFMRGLLKHLLTRIYFPDDPGNAGDPILLLVPTERRATLVAKRSPQAKATLQWNLVIQGENETVFFDF
ncbi:MAG TPA: protocatechuate 3,4-dioxygenase subunit alpha [Casimicrobiaceae bacterium]|nr:protocatechuate 3,4-dioxygenase subunit alpha [Casimicrobiaceae bacterium]